MFEIQDIAILFYGVLSCGVGIFASFKSLLGFKTFIISLLFTPITGMILAILVCRKSKDKYPCKGCISKGDCKEACQKLELDYFELGRIWSTGHCPDCGHTKKYTGPR